MMPANSVMLMNHYSFNSMGGIPTKWTGEVLKKDAVRFEGPGGVHRSQTKQLMSSCRMATTKSFLVSTLLVKPPVCLCTAPTDSVPTLW